MNWLEALFTGLLQGLTEFLPVSSSGHLVIFHTLFGEGGDSNLAFTVFLHLATLVSVIVVFYKDVWTLIREFFTALRDIIKGRPDFKSPERRFLVMVLIGTIPAVVFGVIIKLLDFEAALENIFVVAVMLIVTSLFMFSVDRMGKGRYTEANAPYKSAWLVGLLQGIAILPGLSRSGSTIFGGLLGGLKKEFAVRFAFILSIPVILGAGLMELRKVESLDIDPFIWTVGFIAAAVSGIIAIRFIKTLIKNDKFYIFGVYCLLASAFAFLVGLGIIKV
ncbi:MAG: undecaprenyl-diphosphate phosphatase [Peptococcaceae bacterium]|nr:undecaprenyl-diphosphate phosphatase [Peptococcaceae bacterium]